MELRINNQRFEYFEAININLRYDSVASIFSFDAWFNPDLQNHRELFHPLQYKKVIIEHEGEILMTGTLLNNSFRSSSEPKTTTFSGYSLPGILEDCEIPTSLYPLEVSGLSLKTIAEKLVKKFGLELKVDASVLGRASQAYPITAAEHTQTVKSFLAELASQKNIVLSHDADGRLLLTEAKTDLKPIYTFQSGTKGIDYELNVNGQSLHSIITVIRQASVDDENGTESSIKNHFVPLFRPKTVRQSAGKNNDAQLGVRNYLADELRNIQLVININSWKLNDKIIRPNQVIAITNEQLFLTKETKWFIEAVELKGNAENQTAKLTCVLPEVYNNQAIKNIFS